MNERQEHILRVLADPCSAPNGLRGADRDAIQAALDAIGRLRAEVVLYYHADDGFEVMDSPEDVVARRIEAARQLAEHSRWTAHCTERLRQHRENLRLWESGYLAPTEPDPDERAAVMRELKAAIDELELITGGAA